MYQRAKTDRQWLWACGDTDAHVNERFVIAQGRPEFWSRVRREIDPGEQCSWDSFSAVNGAVTKKDLMNLIFTVWLPYGVSHNRFVMELARVPAFAKFLAQERKFDLCNYVSNPMSVGRSVFMAPYDQAAEHDLAQRVRNTLGKPDLEF